MHWPFISLRKAFSFYSSKPIYLNFFSKMNFSLKYSQTMMNSFHLAISSIFKNEHHGSLIVWLNTINADRHVLETALWPNCKHLCFGLCTAVVSATRLLECICVSKRWVRVPVQGKSYLEIALRAGLCFLAETNLSATVVGDPLGWMFDPLFMILVELCYREIILYYPRKKQVN